MVNLVCSDPLHASRSAQPGWAAVLGTGTKAITGMLCRACATDPTGAFQTAAATANTRTANAATIRAQADQARADNATYLAIPSPGNAQVVAQVRALTQQMNKLIRLVTDQLDATS